MNEKQGEEIVSFEGPKCFFRHLRFNLTKSCTFKFTACEIFKTFSMVFKAILGSLRKNWKNTKNINA